MDRLSALIIVVAAAGCGDSKPAEPSARGNTAKTTAKQGSTTKGFCDVHATAEAAKVLEWPALTSTPPTSVASTWRWINVWATWCQPCIEELPRIAKWRDKLATPKRPLEVTFVSVDESDADIAELRAAHPAIPESLRLAKPDDSPAWFGRLGLDSAAPIPIHIFVDERTRIRCVRAAAIRDTDYAAVEKLLAE
jgi:thiol-disulfide isomerase/thioredoxin